MTYKPEQTRRILKTEQAEYVQQAIDRARTAPAAYEGSLDPTGSTVFYHTTVHEALEHYAKLHADGWTLQHAAPVFYDKLNSFVAIKPESVFEKDIPQIAARAEAAYAKEVEQHNLNAKKLQERAKEIQLEFDRREEERKALLMAEITKQYDAYQNPTFDRVDRPRLNAR
jgi:hypothetical protein